MSVTGFRKKDGTIEKYDYMALDNIPVIPSASGLSDDAKQALLTLAAKVAYIDGNGQSYYNALETALYPPANLLRIRANYVQPGRVYDDATLNDLRNGLTVMAYFDDGTSTAISEYSLSGNLTVGTSTIVVTYGDKTDTFTVNVTANPGVLRGITATFNQGTAEIADTDHLEVLHQYLTVTANYSAGVTETLTSDEYVLSGTLLDAISTITVTYGDFSDEFTVNVTSSIIVAEAHKNDTELTTFTSTAARTVMKDAFNGCSNLQSVYLPNVTEIKGGGNFQGCEKLETINIKGVTRIEGSHAFGWAGNSGNGLTVVLPNITYLGAQTFGMARKMIAVDIGPGLSELLNDTFYANVTPETTLILRKTDGIVTPRTADTIKYIKDLYVPSALIETYQTTSHWATRYSAQTLTIHAIEGSIYETQYADGTSIAS